MDRYDHLDLECDDQSSGGVSQKAAMFGGMFKRSSKVIDPSLQVQDGLSASTELSNSNDSLTENKEKGGMFKGILKKNTRPAMETTASQASLSVQNTDLSASNDSLTDNNNLPKEKTTGVLGGIFRRSPRSGQDRRPSQDNLSLGNELGASNDSLVDNNNTKEKGGVFSGMFKKSKPTGVSTQSQEDLSALSNELSASSDNLSDINNTKEKGGVFSGMFKKSKPTGVSTQSQEDLSASSNELSASRDDLSDNNTKEKGVFSGMFKKSKPTGVSTQSQEDLSTSSSELSASSDNLSDNINTKEKGGMFGGMFRKPKALGDKTKSQEDLSANNQLSVSTDSLSEKTSKGGMMGKILRNPFQSSAQDKERAEYSAAETSNTKQIGVSSTSNSTFYTDEKEKSPDSDGELLDNEQSSQKQNKFAGAMNKLNPFRAANKYEKAAEEDEEEPPVHKQNTVAEAMTKLNPFRSAHKKDSEGTDALKENQIKGEEKPKPVKGNMIQQERKERGESPHIPARPSEEELKQTASYENLKGTKATDHQESKNMIPRERKGRRAGAPKPTAESDDEGLREDECLHTETVEREEGCTTESKTAKVKKPKRHNPFMARAGAKAQSDDEGLKEDETLPTEENKEENQDKQEETKVRKTQKPNPFVPRAKQAQSDDEGLKEESESEKKAEAKTEETKVKKPRKHNPFMPRVKAKADQKKETVDANETAENENASKPLFERLEELRINRSDPEEMQDFEGLMEWWRTVEQWEDVTEDEDMTEKEEAKAFAVTADKVQKGIRVFNKLFSERAESLWQHVIDLNSIADNLDKFNKKTKIAQITGGSTSAIGGVATIVGLALAPVTMGTSLIITAVGLGVATTGGLTSAGAGISNQVNNSMDRKKVEKIVEDYQEKMTDLNKCMLFIKQGIEHLRKFDLLKMKKHAYNRDFPALNSNFYEDGAMAGKAILINANEIMRVVQIANVAGSTAARAVQIASMATGVLTGLFVGMDIYFVAKDSKELKKGAKSEFAAKIRDVAQQLHDGLVELNSIREELHSTEGPESTGDDTATSDKAKKEAGDEKPDSSEEEDEIDRIKKAIKKDYENREYV